jgi:serine protease Do
MFEEMNNGTQNNTQMTVENAVQEVPQTNEMSYNPYLNEIIGKPKKKRRGLKIVAMLCAFALVGAGSIGVYRIVDDNGLGYKDTSKISSSQSDSNDKSDSSKTKAADVSTVPADNKGSEDISEYVDDGGTSLHITASARTNPLSVPDIYSKVIPSVVGIRSTFSVGTGTGTGIIMSSNGYIITNAHVVLYTSVEPTSYFSGTGRTIEEKAREVSVLLSDEEQTEYEAIVIGYDSESDLALLKINETGLSPAEFGDSDNLLVGEDVVAIGNPLGFDLFGTLTKGVVSALNRDISINDNSMSLIQTDTAINSGNSGGPLINCYGQVVGINSAKLSSNYTTSGASIEGLAFAIPITDARKILDDLLRYGYVTGKPQLGITCTTVSFAQGYGYENPVEGAYVVSIEANGAADTAGIRVGDIITAVNDVKISTAEDLTTEKNKYSAGDVISLHITRGDDEITLEVRLAERKVVQAQ